MISRDLSTQILKEVVAELMKRGDHSGAQWGDGHVVRLSRR